MSFLQHILGIISCHLHNSLWSELYDLVLQMSPCSSGSERHMQRKDTRLTRGKARTVLSKACSLVWFLFDRYNWVCPPRSVCGCLFITFVVNRNKGRVWIPRVRVLCERQPSPRAAGRCAV